MLSEYTKEVELSKPLWCSCLMTMHVLDTNITANVSRLTFFHIQHSSCCSQRVMLLQLHNYGGVTSYNIWGNRGAFLPKFIFHLVTMALCGDRLYQTHCCKHIQNVASYPGPAQLLSLLYCKRWKAGWGLGMRIKNAFISLGTKCCTHYEVQNCILE